MGGTDGSARRACPSVRRRPLKQLARPRARIWQRARSALAGRLRAASLGPRTGVRRAWAAQHCGLHGHRPQPTRQPHGAPQHAHARPVARRTAARVCDADRQLCLPVRAHRAAAINAAVGGGCVLLGCLSGRAAWCAGRLPERGPVWRELRRVCAFVCGGRSDGGRPVQPPAVRARDGGERSRCDGVERRGVAADADACGREATGRLWWRCIGDCGCAGAAGIAR
mmetsp:Transcript_6091/g.19117  ORF Transcript_6091/g.19117 Transcript_6091/m.19117 type:complete len:225 (-) Transcript_6091:473-1147(-)